MPTLAQATRSPALAPVPRRQPAPAARQRAAPAPSAAPAGGATFVQAAPPAVRLGSAPGSAGRPGLLPDVAQLVSPPGAGSSLPTETRQALESSLGVPLYPVRVHTDAEADAQNSFLSARAFTVGSHIYLGAKERPTDLALMAHEAAHVVQQEGAPVLQRWSPDQSNNSYEREASQASTAVLRHEPFTVRERTGGPRVQRSVISEALDYIADKVNVIPGFRMFTIILGVNPVNMSRVDSSPANILRALIEFLPGGGLITQALDNSGVFEKVGNWVAQQIKTLGMVGSSIKQAVTTFVGTLGVGDIFHLGDVWERAKRIFTEPIDRIIAFAKGLVTGIIQFVKDAILKPVAKLAEGTAGYDLLKAVLGKDPITGDPVPQTAETIIAPFMKLIGQEAIWENMKKANAIPRAFAWFKGALSGLMSFVSQIPNLFISAFKALELTDIILVPRAFIKLAGVFGGFLMKFISWAGSTIWNLLEIIFDVVSPGALGYIKRTGAALKSILKNPLPFVGNLVKAAKLGFENFVVNFGTHLKAGLIDWLTGSLPGIYIPKAFTLPEVGKFALSILGITWAGIRAKIVKVLGPNGEKIMTALETAFDIVVALVKGGAAAAWEVIKEKLTNLKDMVIGGITDFVIDMVVKKAVPKIVAMFIPGAGFISAILSIYDTIMVFVNKISKIIQVVKGFIDSIVNIAAGVIDAAAKRVENTLAGLLALAINFLAGFAGLGKVADKVLGVVAKVRGAVDKAIDTAIAWIVGKAKALFAKLFGGKDKKDEKGDFREKAKAELAPKFKGKLTPSKMQGIVDSVYAKYQADGLKGIIVKPMGGKASQYEAILIASKIPVSTADADFEIDTSDLDLGWGRTVATGVLKAGSKTEPFGPQRNDGTHHAEENIIKEMNDKWEDVAQPKSTGITNALTLSITRSPCGDMPEAPNCAKKIQKFAARWKGKYSLELEVRAASIYHGKFRKASREAIKKLADSGIKFTAWDIIAELGDKTEVDKTTLKKLQKRIDSTKENLPTIIKVGAGE